MTSGTPLASQTRTAVSPESAADLESRGDFLKEGLSGMHWRDGSLLMRHYTDMRQKEEGRYATKSFVWGRNGRGERGERK